MQPLQLSIPTPCHENWDSMSPNQQGRFCSSCAKTVVDFSAMTDAQLISYFENLKETNVCGRVYPDQLDRTLQPPSTIHNRKKMTWLWQFAAAFIFLFTKGTQVKAQANVKGKMTVKDTLDHPQPIMLGGIRKLPLPHDTRVIGSPLPQYFITDENLDPIPHASIQIFPGGNYIVADSTGRINLGKNHAVKSLVISAVGFEEISVNLNDLPDNNIRLNKLAVKLDAVVVTGSSTRLVGMMLSCTSTSQTIKEIPALSGEPGHPDATNTLSIYPNPVAKGGSINMTLDLERAMAYSIQVSDASGHLLMRQQQVAADKTVIRSIRIPDTWSAGVYFLSIIDDRGKKIEQSKFIID